ncbi:NifU family protein [Actinomycetospora cinnamomea]|uniref:Fe-S cluster biogenesis protein NfuA n=1 Tax=Actinomycetospora cinnamomea TaxID=663609 RepID=A0A2U1FI19_9PSEU|nr:NifU family protein [Actinomycetospora cinnamomea]PVZ11834.1 Fe-S cluster biogenesis protein NfuA [Actinomycetospora cinnamomea]
MVSPFADEEGTDPGAVAATIAELLDELAEEPAAREVGEDLVRVLMQFYGAGLDRIVSIARLGGGDALVHRLAADPLVAALLALHDLHPVELPVRVGHALDTARRRLGSHGGGVALDRVDTHTGTVHVTLAAGCGSSSETVRDVVRTAVTELAPEIAAVEFTSEEPGPTLLQIGLGPPGVPAAGS